MRSHRVVLALAAALAMSPVRQSATAAEVYPAAYQRGGLETFSGPELIASGHHLFGTASKGLALTVEEAVRRWGEPMATSWARRPRPRSLVACAMGKACSSPATRASAGSTGKGRKPRSHQYLNSPLRRE